MGCIKLLRKFNITPILVFDGESLPEKAITNQKRQLLRWKNLQIAEELDQNGFTARAEEYYKRSIEITFEMLIPLFSLLNEQNIKFYVAPYEADAQLSFLVNSKLADFVITEDSDLLVYKSPMTAFKLDSIGNCEVISFPDIFKVPLFNGYNEDQFMECCVLAGCDYLPSIPKMGIKTASKLINQYKSGVKVIEYLMTNESKWDVPELYEHMFLKACNMFKHQIVYDPTYMKRRGIFDSSITEQIPTNIASSLSEGTTNPHTRQPNEILKKEIFPMVQSPYFPSFSKSKEVHNKYVPSFKSSKAVNKLHVGNWIKTSRFVPNDRITLSMKG